MFKVTKRAAEQIHQSAGQADLQGLALRVAVRKKPDGSLDYRMGFDQPTDEDIRVSSEGVEIVLAPDSRAMLEGTVMDFVEIEKGNFRYIFENPNDANYRPGTDSH